MQHLGAKSVRMGWIEILGWDKVPMMKCEETQENVKNTKKLVCLLRGLPESSDACS